MNIQCIAEHSVDLDLLSGGICIDAGCRGFQFSEAMRDLGLFVFACDLEDFNAPEGEGIFYCKSAITTQSGVAHYVDTKDQQAKYLSDSGIPVRSLSLNDLYEIVKTTDVRHIDVLKLDIEGSEYEILSDHGFQPIPKQISVEFHEHAHKELHNKYFAACLANLEKHYVAVKHDRYEAHGCGMNWWDSLFIRRNLIQ